MVYADAARILVAGPSGSGKSTFIRKLQAAELPHALQSRFPTAVGSWPVVEANDLLKRGSVPFPDRPVRDVILHYDTALMRRFGLQHYQQDPIFSRLANDSAVIVVSLVPTASRLETQFETRLHRQRIDKGLLRSGWAHAISPIRRLSRGLRGRRLVDTSRIYKDAESLQRLYEEWEAFALTLVRNNPVSRHIRVQPDGDDSFA